MEKGTVYIVIPHFNLRVLSGAAARGGFPLYYLLDTPWGEKKFRIGDRGFQALTSGPIQMFTIQDGQLLSYIDARNTNQDLWPEDRWLPCGKVSFAAMEMIRNEGIDVVIDLMRLRQCIQ